MASHKIFIGSFSIAIIALTLAVCEAKHLKTLPQNPKSCHEHSLNTHILDSQNVNGFFPPSYNLSIQGSINAVSGSSKNFDENGPVSRVIRTLNNDLESAISSCRELLSLASYNLKMSLPSAPTPETLVDLKTYLCGALAYIETCLDAFEYAPEKVRNSVTANLESSRENVSNSLSILSTIDYPITNHGSKNAWAWAWAWPPSWMSSEESKLLFDSNKATAANVVVAKDGSGKFKTISEAIKSAPQNSEKRFVIYVKQGKYNENVKIDESRWNIMIFGDGMDKTIISGMRSNSHGSSPVDSATFAVHGQGFIARDMGFENTAGPSGGQAVAVPSSSDKSIFYKCSITGYQDTLFSVSHRQFYRECKISGTIDFIFGHSSSAVFQSCTILVRKPLHTGKSTLSPRRESPTRIARPGFPSTNQTSWRPYATTVFMESSLGGGLIDPKGWSRWKLGDTPPDTVYYGEYGNKGQGSRRSISVAEAQKFTVKNFIGGDSWLPATGVPFQSGL